MFSANMRYEVEKRILRIIEYRSQFNNPLSSPGDIQEERTMEFTQREFIFEPSQETGTFVHKSFQPVNDLYDYENNAALYVANHFNDRQTELRRIDMNEVCRNYDAMIDGEERELRDRTARARPNHTDQY